MAAELQVLIRHIRRTAGRRELASRSDRELLTSFACDRDENAFAELVNRHAALVAGVCRRVLRLEQDVEDAFQATFLVLSRRAGAVAWHESAANWLHKVALHLAQKAGKLAARRQEAERNRQLLAGTSSTAAPIRQTWELQEVLDKELACLPAACRSSLILCYLEGRTRDQAARQAGCSLRTLDRRLDHGRQLLRDRLARRGLDLSVVVLAAALGDSAKASFAKLTSMAVQLVLQRASIHAGVACSALKLAHSGIPLTVGSTAKIAVGIVLAAAIAFAGVGISGLNALNARDASTANQQPKSPAAQVAKPTLPLAHADLLGDPLPVGAVARLGGTRFRLGHPEMLAYSPDGKVLFAGCQYGVTLFEAATGRPLRRLGNDFDTPSYTSVVSLDGKLVAVGTTDYWRLGAIFETATGKKICDLEKRGTSVTHFGSFSPDGKLLAAPEDRWQVDLYDSHSGKRLRSMKWNRDADRMNSSSVYAFMNIAFMADGKTLLAASHDTGIIHQFDVQSGAELRQWVASPNGISNMKLSQDGSRLAVLESAAKTPDTSNDPDAPGNKIFIFDSQRARQRAHILAQTTVLGMAWAPDGSTLFTGSRDKEIVIWDTVTGKLKGTIRYPFPGPTFGAGALAVAPGGKTVARSDRSTVHVCDVVTGKEVESHQGHNASMLSMAFDPSDSVVATAGYDDRLLLWDRSSGRMLREISSDEGQAGSLAYSSDGRFLYAASIRYSPLHTSVRCWNSATGKEVWRLDDHPIEPKKLGISPDGKLLGVVGDSDALLIEAATGKPIRVLSGEGYRFICNNGALTPPIFTPDGKELLIWGDAKGIHRWEIANGAHFVQPVDPLGCNVQAVAFSPDQKHLVLGGATDRLLVIDVISGKKVRQFKAISDADACAPRCLAFSPDGKTLAWGGPSDGIVRLVDFESGRIQQKLTGHYGGSLSMAFSHDGKTLVVDSGDSSALVWDLASVPVAAGASNSARP
jgi:RNA polymerase sigma factor (sigma-70 family)